MKKILVLIESSAVSTAAVRFAALLAEKTGAAVTALSVIRPGEVRSELEAALAAAAAAIGKVATATETAIVEGRLVAEASVRARDYDLTIFGASRRRGAEGRRTSLAVWQLAKSIETPVMIVPEEARPRVGRILLCTGGERYIEKGVKFVARLARGVGAEVVLLHVLPHPPELYRVWAERPIADAAILQGESRLARQLRAQRALLESEDVPVTLRIEESDSIERAVLAVCRTVEADMLAVGSAPQRGRLRTSVLGNVTRELVSRAPVPVLIVRSAPPGLLRDLWKILREG